MNRLVLPITAYYCLIFMSGGAYGSYIGLYYADLGLTTLQIAVITSLSALISIIAQPFWGVVSDRAAYKNRVLVLCIVISTVCIWFVPLSRHLLWLIILFTLLFTAFQCAVNPLSDTITLELAGKHRFRFSRVRTAGSLGFAVMSLAAGWIITFDINYIFVMYTILMGLSLCLTPLIPNVKGHQKEGNKANIGALFKNKKLVYIYAYSFLIQATLGFFFSFHAIYSQEQGIGTDLIGLAVMIGSFSQFPFMIFFDAIYKKFGIVNILIFSGLVHAVRWLLCGVAFTPQSIILIWLLHGGTFMLFYMCLAEYVNRHVADELKASGQMANAVIIQGISKIVGNLLGGVSASMIGLKTTFLINSIVCMAAVALFWIMARRLKENDSYVENRG